MGTLISQCKMDSSQNIKYNMLRLHGHWYYIFEKSLFWLSRVDCSQVLSMITNFWSSFASSSHNHNDIIDRQRITTNVKMGYYISRVAQDNHPPVVILYGGLQFALWKKKSECLKLAIHPVQASLNFFNVLKSLFIF